MKNKICMQILLLGILLFIGCSKSKPVFDGFPTFEKIDRTSANRKILSENYATLAIETRKIIGKEGKKDECSEKIELISEVTEDKIKSSKFQLKLEEEQDSSSKLDGVEKKLATDEKNKDARVALLEARLSIRDPGYCLPLNEMTQWEDIPGGIPLVLFPRITSPVIAEQKGEVWYIPVVIQLPSPPGFIGYSCPKDLEKDFEFWLEEKISQENPEKETKAIKLEIVSESNFSVSFFQDGNKMQESFESFKVLQGMQYTQYPKVAKKILPLLSSYDFLDSLRGYNIYSLVLTTPKISSDTKFYNLVVLNKGGAKEGEVNFRKALKEEEYYTFVNRHGNIDKKFVNTTIGTKDEDKRVYANFYYFNKQVKKDIKNSEDFEKRKFTTLQQFRTLHELQVNPIYLEESADQDKQFSFIVAADFQYHEDITQVKRFFDAISDPHSFYPEKLQDKDALDLLQQIKNAKFVVIAGDLVDCAGFQTTGAGALVWALGYNPAKSPYPDEYANLLSYLANIPKPIMAIPGNHDLYTGISGLVPEIPILENINFHLPYGDYFSLPPGLILAPSRIHLLYASILPIIGDIVPDNTLIKQAASQGYLYDGKNFWHKLFGPQNFCFTYQGHTFLGINTFELKKNYRFGTGPLVKHWGGGVEFETVLWAEAMLQYYKEKNPEGHQFLFMHQDPRGITPEEKLYQETRTGVYHGAGDNLWGMVGFATGLEIHKDGLWLPIITPASSALWNAMTGDFHQEWMFKRGYTFCNRGWWLQDKDCYNARPLVEAMVDRSMDEKGGLSHVFLGHDDIPYVSHYQEGESVIRDKHSIPPESFHEKGIIKSEVWEGFFGWLWRNPDAPEWHDSDTVKLGKEHKLNFVRLDNVGGGGEFGFTLVIVDPKNNQKRVKVYHIRLPK